MSNIALKCQTSVKKLCQFFTQGKANSSARVRSTIFTYLVKTLKNFISLIRGNSTPRIRNVYQYLMTLIFFAQPCSDNYCSVFRRKLNRISDQIAYNFFKFV